MATPDIRIAWNLEGFREVRRMFADECEALGAELAEHCNQAAVAHNTNPGRPSGTYDVLAEEGVNRPEIYVRTADARGDLDNALHSTLAEGLYSIKGREIRP